MDFYWNMLPMKRTKSECCSLMGVKRWYFLTKVVKKFSFADLLLHFSPVLTEKYLFCIIFLIFEDMLLLEQDCFLSKT